MSKYKLINKPLICFCLLLMVLSITRDICKQFYVFDNNIFILYNIIFYVYSIVLSLSVVMWFVC